MILDTFFVLFKSNADDLKKGGEEAIKTTQKVEKSLKSAENASEKLGQSFFGMIKQASGALTALLTVGAVIGGFKNALEHIDNIGLMSRQLGYSTEVLDSWGSAVEKAGGSAYYFQYTVQSMDIALKEMAKTGEGEAAKAFKKLGINIKDTSGEARNFIDLLPEIAKSFEGMDKAKSSALGYKLGLDYGTILLLQKGQKEIDALIMREKELGVVTKEQTELAERFKNQQKDTAHAFRSLFASFLSDILPIFERSYKSLEGFAILARKHKDVIVGGLGAIATIITVKMIPALVRLSAAMLTNPAFLLAAAIIAIGVAFGLAYEDIKKFKQGHDSLTGRAFAKWPKLAEAIMAVARAFSYAAEKLGEFESFLNSGGWTINPLKMIETVITRIVDGLKAGLDLWNQFSGAISDGFEAGKFLLNMVTGNGDDSLKNTQAVAKSISAFDNSPISSQSTSSIVNGAQTKNTTSNVNTGPVTINTQATNPDQIANAFSNSLKKQMSFAQSNYDDGVRA